MPKNDSDSEEKTMIAHLNLNQVEEVLIKYDSPNANPFDCAQELENLKVASDNRLALVKKNSEKQKQV